MRWNNSRWFAVQSWTAYEYRLQRSPKTGSLSMFHLSRRRSASWRWRKHLRLSGSRKTSTNGLLHRHLWLQVGLLFYSSSSSPNYSYVFRPTPIDHFGGVSAFSTSDFRRVNGFSNVFFGWGSEDDDLYRRLLHQNLTVTRINNLNTSTIVHYRMFDHPVAEPNPDRMRLFDQGTRRLESDGLVDLRYRRLSLKFKPLYTHIIVDAKPQMHKTQKLSDSKWIEFYLYNITKKSILIHKNKQRLFENGFM